MSEEHVLLPVFVPADVELDIEALKSAKEALVLPFFTRLIRAEREEAAGLRILAVGASPDWVCDSFLVGPTAGQEELMQALEWVFDETYDDPHATRALDVMRSVFGPGTEELDPTTPLCARFDDDAAGASEREETP